MRALARRRAQRGRTSVALAALAVALVVCGCGEPTVPSGNGDTAEVDTAQADAVSPDTLAPDTLPADTLPGDTVVGDTQDAGTTETDWDTAFGHVFAEDTVRPLRLDFEPGDWASMLADWRKQRLRTYREVALQFGDDHLASVGVRFRGYGALTDVENQELPAKFPLKINFDKYAGPRYHGVDKVNLATNRGDLSLMRDRLTARLLGLIGVVAPRMSYGKLTIDGTYVGLYTMAQQVDKRFLKERFGTENDADDGNLYKCIPGGDTGNICDLTWRGATKASYLVTQCPDGYATCGLVLKTNEDDPKHNDYTDLIAFIGLLNETKADVLEKTLLDAFDVDSFLRFMAVNAALRNQDSMAYGKPNNYYLYHRPDTGRWTLLPYDFDMSYGGPNFASVVTSPVPGVADFANCMLAKRVMAVPAFHATFLVYVKEVADTWMAETKHAAWVAEFDALLRPNIAVDPGYKLASYDVAVGKTSQGLLGFVAARRAFLLHQPPPVTPCKLGVISGADACATGMYCKTDGCTPATVGVCTVIPGGCEAVGGAVCGCDGKTYATACAASIAGVNLLSVGTCL